MESLYRSKIGKLETYNTLYNILNTIGRAAKNHEIKGVILNYKNLLKFAEKHPATIRQLFEKEQLEHILDDLYEILLTDSSHACIRISKKAKGNQKVIGEANYYYKNLFCSYLAHMLVAKEYSIIFGENSLLKNLDEIGITNVLKESYCAILKKQRRAAKYNNKNKNLRKKTNPWKKPELAKQETVASKIIVWI